MRRVLGSVTFALVLGAASWMLAPNAVHAAAGGDGPHALTIHADCGSDGPVDVVINLQAGQWSAAHAVGEGAFVPIAFGEQTATFTPPGGSPDPQTYPPTSKGQSAHASGETLNCSFDFTATFPDGSTLHVVGTVTGILH